MKKIKIDRNDIIYITKRKSLEEPINEKINYQKWVDFIERHTDYFLWYENTEDGKKNLLNIDKVPDWAKKGLLKRLNKTNAYSTKKIASQQFDLIIRYFIDEGTIKIDIEKKITKEIAIILLEMAKFLDGKIIINDTDELENIEQLS